MTSTDRLMIDTPHLPRRTPFKPADDSPCLCGSGQSHRHCCAGRLPGVEIRKQTLVAALRGDWPVALASARADVAQNSIWHLTNTAPLLRDDPQPAELRLRNLLDIDVGTLSDYVQKMCDCCERAGAGVDVRAVLDRLRTNIDHDRWRRRLLYLGCLRALGNDWDEDAGREAFKCLGSMTDETDVDILQLYVDLHGRNLGLGDQLAYAERIVELSTEQGQKLHYRALKATVLLMAGDAGGAARELMGAIARFRADAPEAERTLHGRQHFASALCLAGILGDDKMLLTEAEGEIRQLLALPEWTPAGQAELLRQLGDIQRHKADWAEAKTTYLAALDLQARAIHQVFLAQSILFADSADKAAAAIKAVDAAKLDPDEYVDFMLVLTHIAIESGDTALLATAERQLRGAQVCAPLFRNKCDELLILLIDTRRAGPTVERSRGVRHMLSDTLFRITRYAKLEPAVFGIGVNLGKMIDDANARYLKPPAPTNPDKDTP